jgi:ABC-type proline/glycine betaine transport system substrate-binding protein
VTKEVDSKLLSAAARLEKTANDRHANERRRILNSHKPMKFLIVFALVLGVAQARILAAAQAKPEKPTVHIGYASQSGAFAQLWIAAQKGYFQAEGLTAEILFTRTVTGVQAMISGSDDMDPEEFRRILGGR